MYNLAYIPPLDRIFQVSFRGSHQHLQVLKILPHVSWLVVLNTVCLEIQIQILSFNVNALNRKTFSPRAKANITDIKLMVT